MEVDTDHSFDCDYMNDSVVADSDTIMETIISYGLEWDGEDIPNIWLDTIWGKETFENTELYDNVVNTEEYKKLEIACVNLRDAASDLATSENIEAEADWIDYKETLDSSRYCI